MFTNGACVNAQAVDLTHLASTRMVIDVDETRLRTIEQLQQFLRATPAVVFAAPGVGSAAEGRHVWCICLTIR